MSSIPDELYYDILLRLPSRSLLVCRSVCKYWSELISNPSFANVHADLISHRENFICLEPNYNGNSIREYAVHSIGYETLSSLSDNHQDDADDMLFKGGSLFASTPHIPIELVCSCNGLVCLRFGIGNKRWICLWNPATREYKKLPRAPTTPVDYKHSALGYDYKINDYKLVTLVSLVDWTHEILVYTLGSNSWKKIQVSSGRIFWRQSPTAAALVNGAFHWLGLRDDKGSFSDFIISYDINNERSDHLQLPKEASDCVSTGVLEGCLCVIGVVAYFDDHELCNQVIVWVMQEYGVTESWHKRYVIKNYWINTPYHLSLLWDFKNGEILFSALHELFIYNPKDGSARRPNLRGSDINNGVSYFETLVSLKSGTYMKENGEIELSIEDEGKEEESI